MKKTDEEVNILYPDEKIQVGGNSIRIAHLPVERGELQVAELTFGQALKIEAKAAPLIASVVAAVTAGADRFDWNVFSAAAAAHPEALTEMLCLSTGETAERLDSLSDRDGRTLLVAFFKMNWDFFLDRVIVHQATRIDAVGPPEPPQDPPTH